MGFAQQEISPMKTVVISAKSQQQISRRSTPIQPGLPHFQKDQLCVAKKYVHQSNANRRKLTHNRNHPRPDQQQHISNRQSYAVHEAAHLFHPSTHHTRSLDQDRCRILRLNILLGAELDQYGRELNASENKTHQPPRQYPQFSTQPNRCRRDDLSRKNSAQNSEIVQNHQTEAT